jgi:transcription initiation factor TFIIIB Brf1 subunit/transcription initiation factor TFIIB
MNKRRKLEEADNRITDKHIAAFTNKIWQDQPKTAGTVAREASKTVKIAYRRNSVFFSGKSKRGVVAGLFYCLGLSLGSFKTQREIAQNLKTTEMTVRASSRDWHKQFPDLVKCERD